MSQPESQHESHHEAHHEGSSVRTYILIALILGVITYIEFAIVEYQDTWFAWMNPFWRITWLVVLSVVKFILVVMFFMHLKQDDRTFTGFFSSGMVIAVGTLFALSALFTVRSLSFAQTPQEEIGEAFLLEVGDGEHVYEEACSGCHQPNGRGVEGAIPPQAGHTPLLAQATGGVGGRDYMINVVLHGLEGQIRVREGLYDGIMAPLEELSDEEIAEVLNFSVSAWGNEALLPEDFTPFSAEEVAEVRHEERSRFEVYALRRPLEIPEEPGFVDVTRELEDYFEIPPPKTLDVTQINIDPWGLAATDQSAPYAPGSPVEEAEDMEETAVVGGESINEAGAEPLVAGDGDQDTFYGEEVPTDDFANLPTVFDDTNVPLAKEAAGRVRLENPFAPGAQGPAQRGGQQGTTPTEQQEGAPAPQGGEGSVQDGPLLTEVDASQGEAVFSANCASCHQATGQGVPGAFPPLVGHAPELALAEGGRDYLIHLLLYGLQGEIQVNGQAYNGVMPAWQQLSDEELASTLNYILTAWENAGAMPDDYAAFTPEEVAEQRDAGLSAQQVYELRQTLELP